MADTVNAWTSHGAVARSQWCEIHAVPHVFEYKVYRLIEAAGQLNIHEIKTVRKCDLR